MNMLFMNSNTTDCIDRENWFVDNGATHHVTMRKELFQDFQRFDERHTVTTANGIVIEAVGKGSIKMKAVAGNEFFLRDVWFVPCISRNLFSVLAAQDKNPQSLFESRVTTCQIKIDNKVTVTGDRKRFGGLFKLKCTAVLPEVGASVNVVDTLQLYHERMGHQDKRHVRSLIERELNIKTKDGGDLCEGCIFGKTHRRKFGVRERAKMPGELIHADVCGPFPPSEQKLRYFLLCKDDYSGFRYVYFLREKSEVPEKLKHMLAQVKTSGYVVKELLTDNGGEFVNEKVKETLNREGIRQRLTCPYTPEQNGCCERDNRTVVESARAMMHTNREIPESLWAELVQSAVYILNRTGPTRVNHKTPYELWFKKKPSIKHLRIIGSVCYAHIPQQKRKKLHKKATKCIMVGYDNDDSYRLWDKERNSLVRSRDVTFDERPIVSKLDVESSDHNGVTELEVDFDRKESEIREDLRNEFDGTSQIEHNIDEDCNFEDAESVEIAIESGEENVDVECDVEEDLGLDDAIERLAIEESGRVLRDRSTLRQPVRFNDFPMAAAENYFEPSCYKEALECSERKLWEKAMKSEMNSLKENKTWVLEKLPENRKAIPCKWVYRVKLNADGSVDKYKARLVAKGFRQKKGVDFDQTFSPVARLATVRSVLSIAASEGLKISQFDVSTAFLYGSLSSEKIYMKQPEGFDDGSGRVCLLKKSLYGLKQSPRCWNKTILDFMKEIDFNVSDADPCLFMNETAKGKLIVALYVDDGLVVGSTQNLINEFLGQLESRFKITTKPASFFLGLEISNREDGCLVHQKSYANKILKRFGMQDCRPVTTPVVKEDVQDKIDKMDSNVLNNYRQIVGALSYLMIGTRPDLAYAVSVVSRSLEKPTPSDCLKLKRILRYVQYTADVGILYKKGHKKGIIESYSDADHGGDNLTGRSTSGVICLYAGGPISWLSQRQTSVAISTTEAEVVAASEAARECIWLNRLFSKLVALKGTPVLNVDNEAAIKLAENPEYHRRTKHIRTRHFFVRELVTDGELKVKKVTSEEQLADMFTKPLARFRLSKLCEQIGLQREKMLK